MKSLYYFKSIKPVSMAKGILYGFIIIFMYQSALKQLILHDWAIEDYSHCYFIPFIIIYLLWEKRDTLLDTPPSLPSWSGLIPLVLGIILFWVGELGGEFFTMYLSFWLVIVGLSWMHLGRQKVKAIWFTFFIMLTMFPFPNFINNKILLKLKLISSQLGVTMLQLSGFSAYREGNIIDLGFTQLQVVDACSGMRYVMPLLVLSILVAYWFRGALWKKIVIVISSIPVAILCNGLRIAATGILYRYLGAQVAEGFFHDFSGWLVFMFSVPVLVLEMWILNKIGRPAGKKEPEPPETKASRIQPSAGMTGPKPTNLKALLQPVFVVAMLLLITTFFLSHGIEFREKIPIQKSFSHFPSVIGDWTGTHQGMEINIMEALHFSDYIMMNYRNPQGQVIDLYVAYYESQRKGEATHSPETCLPGGGWEFKQSGPAIVDSGNGRTMPVNRAFIVKNDTRQLVYFWFPQRGRILTSLYQVKLYAFWDALTRQRTDGALVRVITPMGDGEEIQQAEARLSGFVKLVNPVLEGYIPK